jgi:hypothetical protein
LGSAAKMRCVCNRDQILTLSKGHDPTIGEIDG